MIFNLFKKDYSVKQEQKKTLVQGFMFFAKNCMHALKEMTSPKVAKYAIETYKEFLYVFLWLAFVVGASFIFIDFESDLSALLFVSFVLVLVSMGFFIKNTLFYLDRVVGSIISPEHKRALSEAKICLDSTCCIPGDVENYRFLLKISITAMVALIVWQFVMYAFDLTSLFWLSPLILLGTYAGFIHSDKRLYEISKLLRKDEAFKDDKWLVRVNEFFRVKFIYVSLPGFFGTVLIFLMGTLLNCVSSSEAGAYFSYGFTFVSLALLALTNQIVFRILHISAMDEELSE